MQNQANGPAVLLASAVLVLVLQRADGKQLPATRVSVCLLSRRTGAVSQLREKQRTHHRHQAGKPRPPGM
jgi:hypothetical protein